MNGVFIVFLWRCGGASILFISFEFLLENKSSSRQFERIVLERNENELSLVMMGAVILKSKILIGFWCVANVYAELNSYWEHHRSIDGCWFRALYTLIYRICGLLTRENWEEKWPYRQRQPFHEIPRLAEPTKLMMILFSSAIEIFLSICQNT